MIIADTSVISAFAAIKQLILLRKILGQIYLPKGVLFEILESKNKNLIKEVQKYTMSPDKPPHLEFISIFDTVELMEEVEEFKGRYKLGRGEGEVILIAKKKEGIALLDDKHARDVAKREQVECYGTLALLRMCYESELINKKELKCLLDGVIEKGNLYITSKLYNWILEVK